jgi:hypothetical protein
MKFARCAILALAALSPVLFTSSRLAAQHGSDGVSGHSALIDTVREATASFRDARNVPEGYGAVLGCVSGPEAGAMGVHFVNAELLLNAELVPTQPEALIYELKGGGARLVGVEFIVFADVWHQTHAPNDPPVLDGHLLHFVESPNRFGLPAHYELHVWAWRDNPGGAFADWNTRVSCDRQ